MSKFNMLNLALPHILLYNLITAYIFPYENSSTAINISVHSHFFAHMVLFGMEAHFHQKKEKNNRLLHIFISQFWEKNVRIVR